MKWTEAISKARKQLGIKGFTPIKKGTKLYKTAKSLQGGSVLKTKKNNT